MQINTNLEMRALELHRGRLKRESAEVEYVYAEAAKLFGLCPAFLDRPFPERSACGAECGQCQGTGWLKREQPISNVNTAAGKRLVIKD